MKEALERVDSLVLFQLAGHPGARGEPRFRGTARFSSASCACKRATSPSRAKACLTAQLRAAWAQYADKVQAYQAAGHDGGTRPGLLFRRSSRCSPNQAPGRRDPGRQSGRNGAQERGGRTARAPVRTGAHRRGAAGAGLGAAVPRPGSPRACCGRWGWSMRPCGALARGISRRAPWCRGRTRSSPWPPSSTAWPNGWSATAPARWANCCRRSRRRRRPSTAWPIRCCCWTPRAACKAPTPPPRSCWASTPIVPAGELWAGADPGVRAVVDRLRAHVLGGKGAYVPRGFEEALRVARDPAGERIFLPRATPIYGESGAVGGVAMVFQDATRLFRFDELKNNLVATVAHEFRTPLTSLRMALHLCLEQVVGPLTEKQSDLLFAAREDCERLQVIVDDLLNLSRIESGHIDLHRRRSEPETLVDQAVEVHRAAAETAQVSLRTEVPPGLAEVFVDPERLHLVFSNLISNAIRYSPAGGEIVVRARELHAPDNTGEHRAPRATEVHFEVVDQRTRHRGRASSRVVREVLPRSRQPGWRVGPWPVHRQGAGAGARGQHRHRKHAGSWRNFLVHGSGRARGTHPATARVRRSAPPRDGRPGGASGVGLRPPRGDGETSGGGESPGWSGRGGRPCRSSVPGARWTAPGDGPPSPRRCSARSCVGRSREGPS